MWHILSQIFLQFILECDCERIIKISSQFAKFIVQIEHAHYYGPHQGPSGPYWSSASEIMWLYVCVTIH